MKRIEATLPAMTARGTIEQLSQLEIDSLVTSHVTVIDRNRTHKMTYRGCAYDDNTFQAVKLELNVSDKDAARAESLLAQSARN